MLTDHPFMLTDPPFMLTGHSFMLTGHPFMLTGHPVQKVANLRSPTPQVLRDRASVTAMCNRPGQL